MDILESQMILQGKILTEINKNKTSYNINDYEFKVFSQWGEDGIIQFLINKIKIKNKIFIEFGVENYKESNTRFLLQNDNWSGLVIDGDKENINFIKNDDLYWRYSLQAVNEFITRDNINEIILNVGIKGDIGILSIDVDGNDYWIFDAITCVSPQIVIIEYNSLFGKKSKISVPYDEKFNRTDKHFSNLYWGASISALSALAKRKGYELVGSNIAGCNLFFIRKDSINDIVVMSSNDAYVESKFRQSRGADGELTFLDNKNGLNLIGDMEVVDIDSGSNVKLKNIKI